MSNALPEIWTLSFYDRSGAQLAISGTCDVLELAYEDWRMAKNACDGTGPKIIRVEGFTNSADRASMSLTVVVEDIIAAVLVRMT